MIFQRILSILALAFFLLSPPPVLQNNLSDGVARSSIVFCNSASADRIVMVAAVDAGLCVCVSD